MTRLVFVIAALFASVYSVSIYPSGPSNEPVSESENEIGVTGSNFKTGTWTGRVVNLSCFSQTKKVNNTYEECAGKQVESGQPMGLLKDGNILGVLVADPENAKAYEIVLKGGVVFEVETTVKGKMVELKGMNIIMIGE